MGSLCGCLALGHLEVGPHEYNELELSLAFHVPDSPSLDLYVIRAATGNCPCGHYMNTFSDTCGMVMLDIEYRYSGEAIGTKGLRRKNVREMEDYVRNLVLEMQSADIPANYISGFATEGEMNMVYIN